MDGGIRMPSVARWPGHIPPNTNIDVPTSQMDIMPTLLAVWGQSLPSDRVIDGLNIYPLLTGANASPPHRYLFHYCGVEIHSARYTPDSGTMAGRHSALLIYISECDLGWRYKT